MALTHSALGAQADILRRTMFGFGDLLLSVQGMLAGLSLATGEIWETHDYPATRRVVYSLIEDFTNMTADWGVEQ